MTTLADAAEERKARLLALRKRKAGADGETETPTLKHRNYDPATRTLRKPGPAPDVEMAEEGEADTVERVVDGLAERIIAEDAARRHQELDILSIAPKRPNWDLKQEMERKLARLERKTQEAILLLTRQRLAAQKGQGADEDLVGAMDAQARQDASDSEDD